MEVVFVEAELPAKSPSHDIPVVTMLDWEFYVLNATTTLLWLCQTVDHLVLVGLISLGAVCVLVSLCVLVSCVVRIFIYEVRTTLGIAFDLFVLGDYTSSVSSRPLSYALAPEPDYFDPSDILRDAALARLAPDSARLSLPQSLALHPDQRTELPAMSLPCPSMDSVSSAEIAPPAPQPESSDSPSQRRPKRHQRRARVSYVE